MTTRVIKSVSSPSVSVREPLAPGRGRETRARDGRNPRTRSAPSSPDAGRKLLVARKKSTQRRVRSVCGRRQQNAKRRQAGVTTISSRQRHTSIAVIETPGYTLCRTPTNVLMNINTAAFFGDEDKDVVQSEPSRQGSPPDVAVLRSLEESVRMQQLLQREIADVSVRLQQEKEDHQQHIEELQDEFEKEKKHIVKAHQIDLSNQQERHERETKILQEKHSKELLALESKMSAEISRLRGELEFIKELMERTKTDLISDAEERLKEREQELSELQSTELQKLTESLHAEAESRLLELRVTLEREMKEKEEELKLENEGLLSQCSNLAELEDELTENKKQIKKLEHEISELEDAAQEAHTLQVSTEAQLLETQCNLEAFEKDFQDKVRTVEDHHRSRIDRLLQENTALRRRLLLKTEEFSQYRSSVERSQRKTLNTFKEKVKVVVQARSRADLGVAMGLDETSDSLSEDSGRPLSAPTTRGESGRAKGRASSAAVPAKIRGLVPFRPHSCHPELNRHSFRKHY